MMFEIAEEDVGLLDILIEMVRELVPLVRDSRTLIGVGEVWESLRLLATGEMTEFSNTLSLSIMRGTDAENESRTVMLEVSEEGVELSVSRYVFSSSVGGDSEAMVFSELRNGKRFDDDGFWEWAAMFKHLEQAEDVTLEIERYHV